MNPSHSKDSKSPISPKITLITIIFLFTILLLILLLHLYIRWQFRNRANRHIRRRRLGPLLLASDHQTHPLDPSILASLPILLFCSESGECAICLNEFNQGDKIRSLTDCAHCFHVECIDMWFHSHSNCPLCRAAVVGAARDAAESSAARDFACRGEEEEKV